MPHLCFFSGSQVWSFQWNQDNVTCHCILFPFGSDQPSRHDGLNSRVFCLWSPYVNLGYQPTTIKSTSICRGSDNKYMELILVSTGSYLFWRFFMVSVITTVGIAQVVWQFSLQMLPYQFLLQGHDKLSNSVLWNSLNDISRFNFLMLLTIWLDRATILRMRHSCLWKETLMSSRFWLLFAHFTSYFCNKKLSWDV